MSRGSRFRFGKTCNFFPLDFQAPGIGRTLSSVCGNRAALFSGTEPGEFIVSTVRFPAAVEDTEPLERQRPKGGVMRLFPISLLLIVLARPGAFLHGMLRPFMKGLADELRTGPTPMHPGLLAAARLYRSNAAVTLQVVGRGKAVALRAQSSQQPRRHGGSGARKRCDNGEVGMRFRHFVDLAVAFGNRLVQLCDQSQELPYGQHAGF